MIVTLMAAPALAAQATSGSSNWVTLIVSVVVGLGGGGTLYGLLKVRSEKRNLAAGTEKIKAEAVSILADSAAALLGPLRDEVTRANKKVEELATRVVGLEVTLARERIASDTRIRQLEADIAARDEQILQLKGRA